MDIPGVLALSSGSVSEWAGRSGKILLLVAGLAVFLDLIGPARITSWATKAVTRRDSSAARLRRMRTARRLRSLERRMYDYASTGRDLATDYFTVAEFAELAREIRAAYGPLELEPRRRESYRTYMARMDRRAEARTALRNRLAARLSEEENDAFTTPLPRDNHDRWTLIMSVPVIGGLVATVLLVLTVPGLPAKLLVIFVYSFVVVLAETFYDDVAELAAIAVLSVQIFLARAALVLIGEKEDAHPLRWAALTAFLAGSVLDLVVSW